MIVYLTNIALMILGYMVFVFSEKFKNGKLYFCVQATVQWILISGLRSTRVGADTQRYKDMFEMVEKESFGDIFSDFIPWLLGSADVKDPGYSLLQKVFQVFSTDYQVFLFFVAIVFMVPLGIWIYRNSPNALLSFVIFSTLFYSFFAITGSRQTIVTGIGVFIGDELIKKKKFLPFAIILLLLIPIHKSAIAMIVLPFLRYVKLNPLLKGLSVIVMVAAYLLRSPMMTFLSGIIGYEQYDIFIVGAGANTFSLLYYIMIFVGFLLYEEALDKTPDARNAYIAMIVGAILLPLTTMNPSAMRAVQYFSVFLMIFIPYIIKSFKNEVWSAVFNIAGTSALVFLLVRNAPSYTFFWQV